MDTATTPLRVGVIGAGTMGQHHVRILTQTPSVLMAGFYDPDEPRSQEICDRFSCRCFVSLSDLLDVTDAVTIAAPTSIHLDIGKICLGRGIHILMEKPLAHTVAGARELIELARAANVVLMVGHIERYNPAVGRLIELVQERSEEIITVDARRLSPFDGTRCIDVDVLSDLLIHDVDLALEIVDAPLVAVSATGRTVFSPQTDVVHARIEFANRAAAVFWTSRCSPHRVRSITVTTPSRYIVADTITRSLTVCTAGTLPDLSEGICRMEDMTTAAIPVPEEEPLRREIEDFIDAVQSGRSPLVPGERALAAIEVLELVRTSIAAGGAAVRVGG